MGVQGGRGKRSGAEFLRGNIGKSGGNPDHHFCRWHNCALGIPSERGRRWTLLEMTHKSATGVEMLPVLVLLVLTTSSPGGGDGTGSGTPPGPVVESQEAPAEQSAPSPGYAVEDLAQIVPSALPLGERLLFRATVEWQGASVLVGHLELATWREDQQKILHARGLGQRFGYTIDQKIVSTLGSDSSQPISFMNSQRGTEHHTKKLRFQDGKIFFSRRVHCLDDGCTDKEHQVSEVAWKGPIPWGTEEAHCADKKCGDLDHEHWIDIKEHDVDAPYVDLLTAIYVARTASQPLASGPLIIPVVNDDSRWYVEVHPRSQQAIKVEEGEYEAIEMALNPVPSDGNEKKRFEGLFGIHGTLRVWFDTVSGRPLLIEGTLPFAYLNLKARIELISVGDAESVRVRHQKSLQQAAKARKKGK